MEKLICSSAEFTETIENTIKDGGCVPLIVSGNSMTPFLKDGGDIVWLRACTEADFKRGKILLFKRNDGMLVLHRIRKVLPDGELLMNGDAQSWCEKIKRNQAVAVVSDIECGGKRKSCDSLIYKIRNLIWHILKPVRPLLMRVWRRLNRKKN